jgi:hypothetical protein
MMAWIRGFFTVVVAVLIFFSVLSLNLFGILSSSLTYENVYEESSIIFEDVLQDLNVSSIIEKRYPAIVEFCENNSEFVFGEEGYVFEIPCDSVIQGTDAVLQEGVKSVINKIYYGNYSEKVTDYLDEPQEAPLFLISEKAHNFTSKIFYYSILLFIFLIVALFFLVNNKSNTFLLPGIFMVVISLLFFKINSFFSHLSDGILFQFLGIFFSRSFPVSMRLLIIGILLIAIAIVFKVFKVGFWVSSLIEKFKEKKNISKNINKIKKK